MEVSLGTAAPSKTQSGGGAYEVGRPQGQCCLCGQPIEPQQRFMAALIEMPTAFQRNDYCATCWEKHDRTAVLAFWQTAMPRPEQKKRLFVDDTVLCELFERLADVSEPAKVNFRFVLGLILMRKRLLVYEATRQEGEREIWSMRMKGTEQGLDMVNPKLDESQMKDVGEQLGQILQEGL
jgi:hypothetical protein